MLFVLAACAREPTIHATRAAMETPPTPVVASRAPAPALRRIHVVIPPIVRSVDGVALSARLIEVGASPGDELWLGSVGYYMRMAALETRRCYERALATSHDLDKMSVTVRIALAASGEATSSEVVRTNAPREMGACVANELAKITWSEGDDARVIEATYRYDKVREEN